MLPALRRAVVSLVLTAVSSVRAEGSACATVDEMPQVQSTGGRFTFSAHVPDWHVGMQLRVSVALEHSDGTEVADCDASCTDETGLERACTFCKCAACPLCSIGTPGLLIGAGCKVPGQIVSCSNARTVSRGDFGANVLHLGASTDRKFGCTIAAPGQALHTPPEIECITTTPAPPSAAATPTVAPPTMQPMAMPAPSMLPPPLPRAAPAYVPPRSVSPTSLPTPLPRPAPTPAAARPNPPPAPPAWVQYAQECLHLLAAPEVEALSSASFRIRPALSAAPTRCEHELQLKGEYRRGSGTWHGISLSRAAGLPVRWQADNLRCGAIAETQCTFRIRPEGWGETSKPSKAVSGRRLPVPAATAVRLEAALLLGTSGSVRMGTEADRAKFTADVATVLRLPSAALVSIVEVREVARGAAAVVFDLHATPTRTADTLAKQFASLLPQPRSELYGGDVTQYLDRKSVGGGLLRLAAGGMPLPLDVVGSGVLSVPREAARRPSYFSLILVLAILTAVLVAYVRGITWPEAVDMVYALCVHASSMVQARMGGGGGGGGRHVKLATEESLVGFAPVVELSMGTPLGDARLAKEVVDTSLDPATEFPPGLPQLRPLPPRAAEEEPAYGVDEDEALQRARRLIAALGSGSAEAAAPVTLAFPPEPLGVPEDHTGFVENVVMGVVEPMEAEEIDVDGTMLLRL